jgi:6-phosphogluconolactonase (cycloisomerase 2 family)
MKLSRIGRISMAFVVSVAMGLGMTACGGGTVGFMWVLGTQYNQIAGFKIDDYTGNLTQIVHSPFSSGGANPVDLVVVPGGRYVYVVNQGSSTATPGSSFPCGTSGSITEFSVGGGGILTFQQCFSSQGSSPVWAAHDSTGSYLYVLDQQAPPVNGVLPSNGDITVFSIASDTGRLTLVLNQQVKDPITGQQLTYFPVGNKPSMMALGGGGCLLTLDQGDQTIFPYSVAGGGQLNLTANSTVPLNSTDATSISTNGSNVYITDAGAPNTPGQILPFTVGNSCSLNTANGGAVANLSSASRPTFSMTTAQKSGNQYLLVLNQSTTNSNASSYSSISSFIIDPTTGKLSPVNDPGNNPYKSGAGPVCMVEDPTDQYIYTSNGVDGTASGFQLDNTSGELSNLKRGSTFAATGQATCLAVSPNVD